jgi:hypothetical protein
MKCFAFAKGVFMRWLIMKNGLFYSFGSFSKEYPEAELFTSRRVAIACAKRLGRGAKVIKNYGYDSEQEVYAVTEGVRI